MISSTPDHLPKLEGKPTAVERGSVALPDDAASIDHGDVVGDLAGPMSWVIVIVVAPRRLTQSTMRLLR